MVADGEDRGLAVGVREGDAVLLGVTVPLVVGEGVSGGSGAGGLKR